MAAEGGGADAAAPDAPPDAPPDAAPAAVAGQALACVLRIIAGVLHGHVGNCVDFLDSDGPEALGWLLATRCAALLRDSASSASARVVGGIGALLSAAAASRELTLAAAANKKSGARTALRRGRGGAAVPVATKVDRLEQRLAEQLLGPATWIGASATAQLQVVALAIKSAALFTAPGCVFILYLYCTVTFCANPAHNLTRSPSTILIL